METKKSMEWVKRDQKVIAPSQRLSYFPLCVAKGEGSILTDEDGNEFIDFLSSASSLNLGSRHPVIMKAVQEQLKAFSQYTVAYVYNHTLVEYAERLTSIYPNQIPVKILFGNCGSDGNDAAIKFSRAYTGRSKIITFYNGYHGNTYGSSSLSSCTPGMRHKMGPFLTDIYHFPFYGIDVEDEVCEKECLKDILQAFRTYLPSGEVAAVIIEPLQGDGGILPAHPIFLKKLYELCKERGILFISEEVQQAFFRTGKWFGIENYEGIVPDGIILGKSVGAGFTLGAFMAREEIMNCLSAPAHLFTLGGNATACAAGIAAFDYMKSKEFQDIVQRNCAVLQECIQNLKKKHGDLIGFSRGLGLSYGIGIVNPTTHEPDPDAAYKILFRSYEKGLLVITVASHVLRIQPPVVIEEELLRKGFAILSEAMDDYKENKIPDCVFEYRKGW